MNDVATTQETNGHSKKPSALASFIAANKAVKVNATDKKAVGEAFKKAMLERGKLEKALAVFDAKAQGLAEDMIRCYGTTQFTIDGVLYAPSSRGSRIFYKQMGGSETVEL